MAEESQQIVVTDVLKVEVLDMAVIDLYCRFCYRFVEPVPMIWQDDGEISFALNIIIPKDGVSAKEKFLMQKYKETIENSKKSLGNQDDWSKIQWLEQVNKVHIVECDIVPRSK